MINPLRVTTPASSSRAKGRSLQLASLLGLVLLSASSCGGCDDEKTPTPSVPRVTFLAPEDGAVITALADSNPSRAGVQPAFSLKIEQISQATLTLSVGAPGALAPTDTLDVDVASAGELTVSNLSVEAGPNIVKAELRSANGVLLAVADLSLTLEVAGPTPEIAIDRPLDGESLDLEDDIDPDAEGVQIDVALRLTDVEAGGELTLSVNGALVAEALADGGEAATFEAVTLPAGEVTIAATVTVGALSDTDSVGVTVVDTLPPCALTVAPEPSDGLCDFDLEADQDPISDGLQRSFTVESSCQTVEIFVNGELFTQIDDAEGSQEVVLTLVDGANALRFVASAPDVESAVVEQSYGVDIQAPGLEFSFPEDGELLNSQSDLDGDPSNGIQIDVSALLEIGDGEPVDATLQIDGQQVASQSVVGEPLVVFPNVTLDAGDHALEVSAQDGCGNVTRASAQVSVSRVARGIVINAPSSGTNFGIEDDLDLVAAGLQRNFTVTATDIEPGAAAFIECRRANAQAFFRRSADVPIVGESSFDILTTLPDGAYACRARVTTPTLTSDEVFVAVSLVRQTVEITQPEDGALLNRSPIDVAVRAVNLPNSQLVTLTLEGTTITRVARVADNGVVFAAVPLSPGNNTLTVQANVGQRPSDSVTVTLDLDPPALTFVAPSPDDPTITEEDDAVGDLDDGVQIDVTVGVQGAAEGTLVGASADGGSPVCAPSDAQGSATIRGLGVAPGAVVLRAAATDEAGNEGEALLTVQVVVDRPRLRITAPRDGSALAQPVADVVAETDLAEGVEVRLHVNGAQVAAAPADAQGRATFAQVALLSDQDNTLQVFAADARGQGASPLSHVLVDTAIPVVIIQSPSEGQLFNLQDLDVDGAPGFQTRVEILAPGVADGQPAQLQALCDGAPAQIAAATIEAGAATFPRVTLAAEASCQLTASVTNRAQITGEDSVQVQVDRVAPTIGFARLRDGQVVNINDDADLDTPGVQQTIRVNHRGMEVGTRLRLSGGPINAEIEVTQPNSLVVFGPVTLPDGELILTASGADRAGNPGESSIALLVDASEFALSFFNIQNPSTLNAEDDTDPQAEGLQVEIAMGGVPGMTGSVVRLCGDSAPQGAAACATSGFREINRGTLATELATATLPASLPEGSQILIAEVEVGEEALLVVSEELILTVDSVRPEITAFTLASDELPPVGVINALEDEAPGTPGARLIFRVDGQGAAAGRPARLFEDGVLLSGGVIDDNGVALIGATFDEGRHTVEVDLIDGASNGVADRPSMTFDVDLTAPSLAFSDAVDGQRFNAADDADPDTEGLQRIFVGSSDAEGAEVALIRVVGALDAFGALDGDDVVLARAEVFGGDVDFGLVTVPDGAHRLALRTADEAGNAAAALINVQVDVGVPFIAILSPGDAAVLTTEAEGFETRPGFQATVLVQSDDALIPVAIHDVNTGLQLSDPAVLDAQGQALLVVTLTSGLTTFEARATDGLDNEGASAPVTIDVDPAGCGIAFAAPATNPHFVANDDDGDPANGVNLSFSTVVADIETCLGQPVVLFVDGQEVARLNLLEIGVAAFDGVVLSDDASHQVVAQIDDGQGNVSSTALLTVHVNLIAPQVSITAPSDSPALFGRARDLSASAGLQINLGLSVLNANEGTIEVRSSLQDDPIVRAAPVTGQSVTLTNLTLPAADQTLTVTVTDRARSTATATRALIVDLIAPASFEVASATTNRRLGTTELVWVAPGDDDLTGFVDHYEIRRSDAPITAANFDAATLIATHDAQVAPQQEEAFTVDALPWNPPLTANTTSVTHHIAVVGFDDLGNRTTVGQNAVVSLGLDESRFRAQGAGSGFGFQLGSVGDVNGDGADDMIVAQLDFGPGRDVAHLLYGRADLAALDGQTPATQLLTGNHTGFGFIGGRAVALGDINGDGANDFAISAYFANTFRGRVYVYFGVQGGGQLNGTPNVTIDGLVGVRGNFGFALGVAENFADAADEGLPDLLVGSNSEGAGAAYAILGRQTWPATLSVTVDAATNQANGIARLAGTVTGGEFGASVAGLSDVDGDGFSEIAVAARRVNGESGVVSVFNGGTLAEVQNLRFGVNDQQIAPPAGVIGGLFGSAMVSGDLDGDGTLDLVVDAYAGNDTVAVFLFDQGIPTEPSESWSTPTASFFYGEQLALADVNGDGQLDIIAGGFSQSGNGRLDVYFGDEGTFGGTPDLRLDRPTNWANDVTAGDFDGDGFDDLVAGQHAGTGFIVILY